MHAFKKLAFVIIGTFLSLSLFSCGGGGGGGGKSSATFINGHVVDGFIAGATVTAYQVNANGTQGPQIGTPVTTDQNGDYSLNLGSYTGPVYLLSTGGTYTDTATGNLINLNIPPYSSMVLSAIVSNATGSVNVQINPLTTMAADVALTLMSQGNPVGTAADNANALIQNYFAITSPILTTALVSLTTPSCMTGYAQPSADVSAILAGISQLALTSGVNTPDLVQALIQDVSSDGKFNGLAGLTTISIPLSSGTGSVSLSQIEGPGLTNLASAITSFMSNTTSATANICQATVDPSVLTALSNTTIFTTPAPVAPTGVQATAGNAAAVITWNPVTGASSYNVYMATSTGVTGTSVQLPGFRSIQNVTSPADISTGPTNTYYFVVTAATGTSPYEIESVPSAEVSVYVSASALPPLWAQTVTAGSNASDFNGVATASDGSVYAAGDIFGTGAFTFGSMVTQGSSTFSNVALVKYNSSGVAQWASSVTTGTDKSSFSSVAVAPDGLSVYAVGYIYGDGGTYTFGNNVTAAGAYAGSNAVLVKYTSGGAAVWAETVAAGANVSTFNSVSVASDGSVYAAGYIQGTGIYNFGGVSVAGTSNGSNPVLVKYNSSGAVQWVQTLTAGTDDSTFNGVSVAADGSVYAAGYIAGNGPFNFGNGIISAGTNTTGGNVALVKYTSAGLAQWAQTVTAGTDDSFFSSVSVASDGSVYAAGYIQGSSAYTFGNGIISTGTNTNGINTVLVKYTSAGVASWAQTVTGGSGSSNLFGVSVASDGSVYAAGFIDGTAAYGFGNSVAATGAYSGENVVLVKYDSNGVAWWAQSATAGPNTSYFAGVSAAPGGLAVYVAGDIVGTGNYTFGSANATGPNIGNNMVLVGY